MLWSLQSYESKDGGIEIGAGFKGFSIFGAKCERVVLDWYIFTGHILPGERALTENEKHVKYGLTLIYGCVKYE